MIATIAVNRLFMSIENIAEYFNNYSEKNAAVNFTQYLIKFVFESLKNKNSRKSFLIYKLYAFLCIVNNAQNAIS